MGVIIPFKIEFIEIDPVDYKHLTVQEILQFGPVFFKDGANPAGDSRFLLVH
jgi:hypothetical protein